MQGRSIKEKDNDKKTDFLKRVYSHSWYKHFFLLWLKYRNEAILTFLWNNALEDESFLFGKLTLWNIEIESLVLKCIGFNG